MNIQHIIDSSKLLYDPERFQELFSGSFYHEELVNLVGLDFTGTIEHTFVVEILQYKDIGNRKSENALLLDLSDNYHFFQAFEFQKIPAFKKSPLPDKIVLIGPFQIRRGVALLTENNVRELE